MRSTLTLTHALLSALPAALLFATMLPAQDRESTGTADRSGIDHYRLGEDALALDGYDPVSYRAEGGGEPARGSSDHQLGHAGVTYRFASPANKQAFLADPTRYEPAYGGWCAYAMAAGQKVDPKPTEFVVSGGRLFVFTTGTFSDPRDLWIEDEAELLPKADRSWTSISGEAAPAATTRDLTLFNLGDGALALTGYDPVAYFPAGGGRPAKGKAELAVEHDGVVYYFANRSNRERFVADPGAYEPHFGGYCAYAVAKAGDLVEIDPTSFLIEDGRLLVFYKGFFNDTRASWTEEGGLLPEADRRWGRLVEASTREP